MRYIVVVFLWTCFVWVPSQAQDVATPQVEPIAQVTNIPTLEDFLGRADFWSPELSPSGQYLSGARRSGENTFLVVVNLQAPEAKPSVVEMGNYYVNWVEWLTDDRMVVSATGFHNLRTGALVSRADLEAVAEKSGVIRATRIIAMDRDGSNGVMMFNNDRMARNTYNLGRVVSFLPDQPDHILIAATQRGDLDLFKLDVRDGSYERVAEGTSGTFSWYVDRDGEPAFRFNSNRRGTRLYIYAREDRSNGKIKWRKIRSIRLNNNEAQNAATEFSPLFAGPTETTYYVAARPEGEDKTGIYLYDFEKDEYIETIKVHPDVDVERAIYNRETREIQGVYYYDDRVVLEMNDAETQSHLNGLNAYFDNKANVFPLMSSKDGRKWLIRAVGPQDSGSYHVYDLDKTQAQRLSANMIALAGKSFGEVEVVKYIARDGLELRGYLTRPVGYKEGDKPPLIMMPHGGPEQRDIYTFNYTAQILAAKGYQVFQPNFRGSSGFGLTFADLGRREWGGKMQQDVDDAFDHLVKEGYVARDRACIYGASYGGYKALAAVTLTPELYQCAIATAAPTDLIAMLNWDRKEEGRDSDTYKYWVAHIGDPRKDKDKLNATSPAKLADRIICPVLLTHGVDDDIVPIKQSEIMAKAMDKAGVPYEFVRLEESSHNYRSDEDERKEYEAMLAFLDKHLPVTP